MGIIKKTKELWDRVDSMLKDKYEDANVLAKKPILGGNIGSNENPITIVTFINF